MFSARTLVSTARVLSHKMLQNKDLLRRAIKAWVLRDILAKRKSHPSPVGRELLDRSKRCLSTSWLWNGGYYSPPARNWEFDTRFEDPANLPPGTPVVGNLIHTAFRPVF